jgi:peptidoglycan/xylan/chitin deacetylase (PgdA/CDA1 family)
MGVYAVERFLVGWSAEEVEGLLRRLGDATAELGAHGVRHLESIVIPTDETCLSMFGGPDADTVGRANEALGLPFGRILAASIAGATS